MMKLSILSVFLFAWRASAQDTCTFDDGVVYQRGQEVGLSFPSRCFGAANYPCICNPDNDRQVDCNFCAFATNSGIVRCAKNSQEVTFIDLDNVGKRCTCTAPAGGNPEAQCVDDASAATCVIPQDNGEDFVQQPGDPFGRASRCGASSDFPCICNPNVPNKIECPYCSFATKNQGLLCLADDETRLFDDINGLRTQCTCNIPEPYDLFESDCVAVPTQSPVVSQDVGCTFLSSDGIDVFVSNGNPLGDLFISPCGSPDQFPCFCNVDLPGQAECPYCQIQQQDGSVVCQVRNEVATTTNLDGNEQTCRCEPDEPLPRLNCEDVTGPNPAGCVVPGSSTIIRNGQAFGSEVTGTCGSHVNWPSFCNVALVEQNQVEYPYCQFNNTANGDVICARNGEFVTFVNDRDISVRCECSYNVNFGASENCRVAPATTPTMAPNMNPTSTPAPQGTTNRNNSSAERMSSVVAVTVAVLAAMVL